MACFTSVLYTFTQLHIRAISFIATTSLAAHQQCDQLPQTRFPTELRSENHLEYRRRLAPANLTSATPPGPGPNPTNLVYHPHKFAKCDPKGRVIVIFSASSRSGCLPAPACNYLSDAIMCGLSKSNFAAIGRQSHSRIINSGLSATIDRPLSPRAGQ